jgi:hypothetical protein
MQVLAALLRTPARRLLALALLLSLLAYAAQRRTGVHSEAPQHLRQALQAALLKKDPATIQSCVEQAVQHLGSAAGVPEVADHYTPVPPEAKPLSPAEVRALLPPLVKKAKDYCWWRIGMDPTQMTAPLREPAAMLSGMLALSQLCAPAEQQQCMALAQQAADFLIWAQEQAGAGCYPFPAARGTSSARAMQVASRFLQQAEDKGLLSQTVRHGWAYADHGDGGLQFDNAECGLALLELYAHSHDPRHLQSAVKAAEWAMQQPLCTNWNYNSFSVHLCAKAAAATGRADLHHAAMEKALLGVVPGQLTTGPHAGRWADGHNARPAYHYIMLSALTALAQHCGQGPCAHTAAEQQRIQQALQLGLTTRNAEFSRQGMMTKDKAMECLLDLHHPPAGTHSSSLLATTHSDTALHLLMSACSESLRQGKFPLGPKAMGQMCHHLSTDTGTR